MLQLNRRAVALTLVLLLLAVLLLGSPSARTSVAAMQMPPYLHAVTPSSIYVLVEDDSTNPVVVDYGLTTAYGMTATTEFTATTTASPTTYVRNIKLTGLQPGTLYHYRASQGGSYSDDYTFTSASFSGIGFRFAWLADMRTGTSVHDQIAARVLDANPLFSLYGGDLAKDGSYAALKSEFFRPNQLALIARVPFFNAVGNHEGWGTNTQAFLEAPTSSSGTQAYYSFDYGDLHVLVINNIVSYAPGSAQYVFAQTDLAATTRRWKIVISHYPAYCAGGHGEDADMKTMTSNIFEPNLVDVVVSGHSHFYQHNMVNGIHHLVIGSAGAPLVIPQTASYVLKSVQDYNYAITDVSPTSFTMVVYNNVGTVLDVVSLGHSIFLPFVEKVN